MNGRNKSGHHNSPSLSCVARADKHYTSRGKPRLLELTPSVRRAPRP